MSETTFALEINEKFTRMCDLRLNGKKIELLSLGSYESAVNFFDTENALVLEKQVETIKRLYSNLKIRKKSVNVIIPDARTYSQIVEMPKLKEKELIAAIRYQADEFIPMAIEDTYLDLEILREDKKTKKILVLIVAAPKKIVDQVYAVVDKAGLIPEALENEMSSAGRLFSEVLVIDSPVYLLVNFGFSTTSIYLVDGTTHLIVFARTIKIGLDLFVKDLKINLNWDEAKIIDALRRIGLAKTGTLNLGSIILPLLKELVSEIEKFIALARQNLNLNVKNIYLFNFDTNVAYLTQYLQAYFNIPTSTAPVASAVVPNPIAKTFQQELSSYVSVISGNFR
ncbi:MAG: pilus assembly protein PilM [Patescibacteria group bacterium]|nr:pilus assembly protein PilM [Patescibacteria group bacterium]